MFPVLRTVRAPAARAAIICAVAVLSGAAEAPASDLLPIATDGRKVYSSTEDRSLVTVGQTATDAAVAPLQQRFRRITAVAFDSATQSLVVLDEGLGQILRYVLQPDSLTVLASIDGSRLAGARVAAGIEGVFVGLPVDAAVYRLDPASPDGSLDPLPGLPFEAGGDLTLHAGSLLVSAPSKGIVLLRDLRNPSASTLQVPATVDPAAPASSVTRFFVGETGGWSPGRMAAVNGIAYVADSKAGALSAFSLQRRQPVRLPIRATPGPVVALAASEKELLVWSGDGRAELHRHERPVPVSFSMGEASGGGDLMTYLGAQRSWCLEEPLSPALAEALRRDPSVFRPGELPIAPALCGQNPWFCRFGRPRFDAAENPVVRMVPLVEEAILETRRVTLDGQRTLKARIDSSIRSPALRSWLTDDRLARMNQGQRATATLLQEKQGEVWEPIERIRYVTVLPASAVEGFIGVATRLGATAISLEEVRARAEQGTATAPPASAAPMTPADMAQLADEFVAMLQHIGHAPSNAAPLEPAAEYIGIAEEQIDFTNSSLAGVFEPVEGSDFGPSSPTGASAAPPTMRPRAEADHGTMTSALLAGRASPFDTGKGEGLGLIRDAVLIPLRSIYPTGADDIRRAKMAGVRVVNISLSLPAAVAGPLAREISANPDLLFVVAGGNDGLELGPGGALRVPAILGSLENVIVVGALDAEGRDLLKCEGRHCSNFGAEYVSLVAPGAGFHAPGAQNTWVPAEGSSFATPLVTAAAVLLGRKGINVPWKMKERLVATSSSVEGLDRVAFGGLLDIRRALERPDQSLLKVDEDGSYKSVQLDTTARVLLCWTGGEALFPITDLRRLVRLPDGTFRAYVHEVRQDLRFGQFGRPVNQLRRIDEIRPCQGSGIATKVGGTTTRVPLRQIADFIGRVQ